MDRIPVIVLSGHLGAGKTTVLNHLLKRPGAKLGVVINDFGDINVDASLVSGQVDEPASIAGGCLCCLPDAGGLDDALEKLTHPRLGLDAVIVEASGIAEPGNLAQLIWYSEAPRVRLGGVVEVVDAVHYFETLDRGGIVPARFNAATLVIINKVDQLEDPSARIMAIEERIRQVNPDVHILHTSHGVIDPELIFDRRESEFTSAQLDLFDALPHDHHEEHSHASAVTVFSDEPAHPARLLNLLENPPEGAYRLKGTVTVAARNKTWGFTVNVVGRSIHVAQGKSAKGRSEIVAIGMDMNDGQVRERLDEALAADEQPPWPALKRLQRLRRLSAPL